MFQVLGRKQAMKPEDESKWWEVINHIENYVSFEEVARATEIAQERILKITQNKKAAYSWSGGKDSLVIAELCQSVGLYKCQCLIADVEFPTWKNFLEKNAPPNCEKVFVGFGLDYLAANEKMIFGNIQRWYRQIQQNHFRKYLREKNLDVLILGHRKIDGNFCGEDGIRVQQDGKILFAPIYDWSHELIFAFLHYNKIELPFIYKWRRGFYNGTHCWTERKVSSIEQGYREVYEIDPDVVISAAEKLPSAKKFLEEMKNGNCQ